MKVIGTIGSLWRYPVKSMAGESVAEAYMGFTGFYGDRCYAFKNSAAHKGFPYLNATVQQQMLCYRPKFRFPASWQASTAPEAQTRPLRLSRRAPVGDQWDSQLRRLTASAPLRAALFPPERGQLT
jgi:uncharacterized protein YcbX